MWGLFLNFEYTVIAGRFWYGINSTEENISSPVASNHLPRKQNLWKLNLWSKSLFSFLSPGCIGSDWSSKKDNSSFSDTDFILVKFTLIVLPLIAYAIYVLYKNITGFTLLWTSHSCDPQIHSNQSIPAGLNLKKTGY